MASIFTIITGGDQDSIFDKFILENRQQEMQALMNLARRMKSIATVTGITPNSFRANEGRYGDNVIALNDDPECIIRLYGVKPTDRILIVGSGGPKKTQTWQEDPKLTKEVQLMMTVSKLFEQQISNGKLSISQDGKNLSGNFDLS